MLAWIIDVFTNMHWGAVGQIIMIDILLGGDNAVVIALLGYGWRHHSACDPDHLRSAPAESPLP